MNSFNVWFHALETNISEHLSNRLDPDRQTVSQRPRQGNSCGFAICVPSSWSCWCQLRRETSSFPFRVINVLKNEEVNGKGIWILTARKWGMNKQRESCNCQNDPMHSLEQIHLQVMSHVMQRNIRCSSCCSAGSPSKTLCLPPQLHLTLLLPRFLSSSFSRLHPVPQTHILHLSTGPLHMTFPLPGSALVIFLVIPSSGKHPSLSCWDKASSMCFQRPYPSLYLSQLLVYIYLVTIWWTVSPMRP